VGPRAGLDVTEKRNLAPVGNKALAIQSVDIPTNYLPEDKAVGD
jgi:hypothetical protein